jgi:hypothetical protein
VYAGVGTAEEASRIDIMTDEDVQIGREHGEAAADRAS